MKEKLIYYTLFIFIFYQGLFSESKNTIIPTKTDIKIKMDGVLDEDVWKNANKITNFTQREPNNGHPSTERTEVAFCYNDDNLYIGIWCYDQNPAKIIRKGMKRDFENWRDDTFSIVLDPNNDKTSGYVFIINSNGARRDGTLSKFGNINFSWNGIWDVATEVSDEGWFAEVVIPFASLSFSEKESQEWGINFKRDIRHKVEEVFWLGWSLNSNITNLQNAGKIVFNEKITGNQILDIKPYAMGGLELQPNKLPSRIGKIGGDVNGAISPNIKLNLTFNTDFAQVESDELKVNLSRFSLFFPEKRDFFLESNNIFDFDIAEGSSLFYSRRVGISKNKLVPILAGGKLTGRIDNTTFGLISVQNDKFESDPSLNSSVVRVEHSFGDNTKIGGILTSKINSIYKNYVYATDFNYNTNEFLGDKNLLIAARLAQTHTTNRNNFDNNSYSLAIVYPNNLIETSLMYANIQENFNPELGFVNRTNVQNLKYELEIRPRLNEGLIRNLYFEPIEINSFWTNNNGKLESIDLSIVPFGLSTTTGDFVMFRYNRKFDRLDEGFSIREGFEFQSGEYWFNFYSIEIDTYGGRPLTSWFMVRFGDYYDADYFNFYGFLAYNFNKNLNMNINYSLNQLSKNKNEFIDNKISSRIDYSINPKLSSSLYTQYSNFFNEVLINFRINWIPVVGSDVYFVINQSISVKNPNWTIHNTTILSKFVWRLPLI